MVQMCQRSRRRIGLNYHLESWWTFYLFWDRVALAGLEINMSLETGFRRSVRLCLPSPTVKVFATSTTPGNNAEQDEIQTNTKKELTSTHREHKKERKHNARSSIKHRKRHVVWPRACAECWMFRPQDSLLTDRPVTGICNCSLFPPQQVSDYRGSKRHWTLASPPAPNDLPHGLPTQPYGHLLWVMFHRCVYRGGMVLKYCREDRHLG